MVSYYLWPHLATAGGSDLSDGIRARLFWHVMMMMMIRWMDGRAAACLCM
jgi:hypothetical protein